MTATRRALSADVERDRAVGVKATSEETRFACGSVTSRDSHRRHATVRKSYISAYISLTRPI
jgi:hypothetical protein